jgi:hypothetical protein
MCRYMYSFHFSKIPFQSKVIQLKYILFVSFGELTVYNKIWSSTICIKPKNNSCSVNINIGTINALLIDYMYCVQTCIIYTQVFTMLVISICLKM